MKHIYIGWDRDRKRQKEGKKAEQSKAKKHEKKQSKDRYARRQHETTYIVWMWIGQHISCDRTRTRAYKPKHKETLKENNNNNKRRRRCANSYWLAPQCTYVLRMLDVICRGCCYALAVAVAVPLYAIAAINSMRAMKCDRFTLSILWRWVACLRWRSIAFATINSFFHSFVLLYVYVFHTENSVLLQTYLSCMFLRLLLLFRWFCWARNLVLQNICWFLRTKQRIRKTVEYSYCLAALAINKTSVKAIELNLTKSIVLLVRFAVFFIMLLLFDSYLWCWCYWFAVDVIFFC